MMQKAAAIRGFFIFAPAWDSKMGFAKIRFLREYKNKSANMRNEIAAI
ncbi:MAG TPA: hypothetical protein VJ603_02040 [Paucimonas sp.]|nr:hypothetical protein [Paucimonas sp.]HJW56217.1 hypothetical protein [Burkholderiaceae bacterium]